MSFLDRIFPPAAAVWEEIGVAFAFLLVIWLVGKVFIWWDRRK